MHGSAECAPHMYVSGGKRALRIMHSTRLAACERARERGTNANGGARIIFKYRRATAHHITSPQSPFVRKAIAHEEEEREEGRERCGKRGENHDSFPNVIMFPPSLRALSMRARADNVEDRTTDRPMMGDDDDGGELVMFIRRKN